MGRTKKIKTLVNFILDKSGSMEDIKSTVISGFNEYINGLNKQKGDFLFSLTLFDSIDIEKRYVAVPLSKVAKLNKENYIPGAMTPLYDAATETIEDIDDKIKKEKGDYAVVTVIMTDGYENASTEHDEQCLNQLIKKLTKQGNWTFTYMGANQDAWGVASKLGISKGNVLSWNSTLRGTNDAYSTLAASTSAYAVNMNVAASRGQSLKTANFFNNGEVKDNVA